MYTNLSLPAADCMTAVHPAAAAAAAMGPLRPPEWPHCSRAVPSLQAELKPDSEPIVAGNS